jgi:hypothetical protein
MKVWPPTSWNLSEHGGDSTTPTLYYKDSVRLRIFQNLFKANDMNTTDLTFETLINVISDAIADKVQQKINVSITPMPSVLGEEYLDMKEAMIFLKIKSPNTLYKYVNEGRIAKPIRRGTKPFYKKSDLIFYLNHE